MFQLVFQHARIPRTTSRQAWREIDRWRRVTKGQIEKSIREKHELLQRDDLPWSMRASIMQNLIYPPIMVYPDLPS